jgi:hypothetical protein
VRGVPCWHACAGAAGRCHTARRWRWSHARLARVCGYCCTFKRQLHVRLHFLTRCYSAVHVQFSCMAHRVKPLQTSSHRLGEGSARRRVNPLTIAPAAACCAALRVAAAGVCAATQAAGKRIVESLSGKVSSHQKVSEGSFTQVLQRLSWLEPQRTCVERSSATLGLHGLHQSHHMVGTGITAAVFPTI